MSQKPPSQIQVLLLLATSLAAGVIASTLVRQREVAQYDVLAPLSGESLIAESP